MSVEMLAKLLTIVVVLGGIYTIMALGLTLVYGVTKVFNYAQGSFYTWGCYIAWFLHHEHGLNYQLTFAITIGIMFLFGLVYERAFIYPLRRFAEWQWTAIIVTLGSALFLDSLTLIFFGPLGKTLPDLVEGIFRFGNLSISKHDLAVALIALAIVAILTLFLNKTRTGMAMRGVAQDIVGGNIVGIPIGRMYGYSFGITAVLGGIAGMLLTPRIQIYPYVGWPVLVKAMVILAFGGLGSIKGAFIAGFTMAALETFVTYYIGAIWSLPLFLVVIVIVLVFRPRGLFGVW